MTLPHRRHIVKTTYFSGRGYLFITLIHRIAAKMSSRKPISKILHSPGPIAQSRPVCYRIGIGCFHNMLWCRIVIR